MLWSLVWLTLFFIWIWLLIAVFVDIYEPASREGENPGVFGRRDVPMWARKLVERKER